MAAPEPLHRTIQSISFTDAEIKRIAQNASAEASKVMSILSEKGTTSAAVRSAQVAMAKVNVELWGNIADATKVGIGDAVWNATEMQALFDEALFKKAGFTSQYWRASMIAQAQEGVNNLVSRKQNGFTLSQKVYRNQALSKGYVDRAINNGLLLGKSAREIAADVIGYIDPKVPGGASSAAMRLARTEVNNAFHTTSRNNYIKTPWVERVKWNLSGSHPKPDDCNKFAEETHHTGWGAGEYRPTEVPDKPHPNCLCFVDPVQIDLDAYIKNFKAGKYDEYIEDQIGCARHG